MIVGDVRVPCAAGEITAYAAVPRGARRGVVVIHEILGRQPEIDRVVERFAAAGYAAIAPDLFSAGLRPLCIQRMIRSCSTGTGAPVEHVLAARGWLSGHAELAFEHIGIIGFCLGGGFALAVGGGWGAVSCNYGAVPPVERLQRISPVIACYGGRDRAFAGNAPRLAAALRSVGAEHEVHVYPDAGHSFLTDGDHPIGAWLTRPLLAAGHDPVAAEDAWRRIFAFFDRHLTAPE